MTSTQDLFDVRGKVALVTGGSRGIGLMIARGLVRGGVRVLISSRKAEDCEAAALLLSEHGECEAIPADVSTQEGAVALAAAVRERSERLDILVNNAGATWGAPLEEFPQLRAAGGPEDPARVINIGSVDGIRVPVMENYSYSASKAAVHMLTRHLAKRLASEQITVNAIAPGPFESKMTKFMLGSDEGRAAVESTIPLGRIGHDADIAGLTIYLSSRAGAYLTGTVIPLDGGYSGC